MWRSQCGTSARYVDDKHQDHRIRNLLVKDIMSKPVVSVSAGSTVDEAITMMVAKKISSIPVVRGETLAGLVTRELPDQGPLIFLPELRPRFADFLIIIIILRQKRMYQLWI